MTGSGNGLYAGCGHYRSVSSASDISGRSSKTAVRTSNGGVQRSNTLFCEQLMLEQLEQASI